MKCLVTGGTGFIGRVLVRELVSRFGSENIVCLTWQEDNELERSGRAILQELGVRTIPADIRHWQPAPDELPQFDILYHLAASTDSGAEDHSTNDQGTQHLLNVLRSNLRGTRVVFASSTAAIDRRQPALGPLTEQSPCHPRTIYGKTKLKAEEIIKSNAASLGYTYNILRFSTVYGYGTRIDGLFDKFKKWVKTGHPLGRVNWPGRTGLIYIDNLVDIVIEFSLTQKTADDTYCIVADSPPIGEIPRQMARSAQLPFKQINVSPWVWTACKMMLTIPELFSLPSARLSNHFWRLSLIVDHGLWADGTKMNRIYTKPLKHLEDGIDAVMRKHGV